jgi:hypothetical protein
VIVDSERFLQTFAAAVRKRLGYYTQVLIHPYYCPEKNIKSRPAPQNQTCFSFAGFRRPILSSRVNKRPPFAKAEIAL